MILFVIIITKNKDLYLSLNIFVSIYKKALKTLYRHIESHNIYKRGKDKVFKSYLPI